MRPAPLPPIERPAARVLCLDPTGAVLLQRVVDPAVPEVLRWISPGGGIEPGESAHDAARREIWEELGLTVDDLGAPAQQSTTPFDFDGLRYLGVNTTFALRTERFEPVPRGMTEAELAFTLGTSWVSADELDALAESGATVAPAGTPQVVRRLHAELPAEVVRPTVRVLVVDGADNVLLMHSRGGVWFPPGGGIEPGESTLDAGRRELREELGLDVGADGGIGPWVWTRRHLLPGPPQGLDLRERWHLLRVDGLEVDDSGWTPVEVASIDEVRWWSPDQLRSAPHEVFSPRDLAGLLPQLLADERAGRLAGRRPVRVPV